MSAFNVTSHLFLNSAFRDRTRYPSPSDFVVEYTNRGSATTGLEAHDYVSVAAPLLQVDMLNTFTSTSSGTFPTEWINSCTVIAPTVNATTSSFTVTFGGSPNYPSGLYNNIFVLYNDGFTTQRAQIESFTNLNNNTFLISLYTTIDFVSTATTLTISTPTITSTLIYIPTSTSLVNRLNYYIGKYLYDYVNNQVSLITQYDNNTQLLTLGTALTNIPTNFIITDTGLPAKTTITTVSSGTSTITVNTLHDYVGQYIYNFRTKYSAQVQSVSGTYDLRLKNPVDMSQFVVTDDIMVLPFTRDGDVTLRNIATASQNLVCHDVQLLSLHIPNLPLALHPGGYLVNYPYLLVELINVSGATTTTNVFYTNDPNVRKALFICPVLDIASPEFSSFTKLSGPGINQTIKFKLNDTFRLVIRTPYGQPLTFTTSDTLPPYEPDPRLQISALFSVTPTV